MPDDATQVKRLKWLFGISALLHMAGGIYCLVRGVQTEPPAPQLYSYYRPRVAGQRLYADASNASDASHTSSANVSSFIQDLEQAYVKACPLQNSAPRPLLMLEASFDAKLGLRNVSQTWMPERYAFFGMAQVNGFLLLSIVFVISLSFQAIFLLFCFQEKPLGLFRQPCILRWLEYAFTSPLQIVLIASCVLIRDVHTVTLLLAAQLVCVLLGFAVESANADTGIEDNTQQQFPSIPIHFPEPKTIRTLYTETGNDTEAGLEAIDPAEIQLIPPPPPPTPEQIAVLVHARKQNARKSLGLWLLSFAASTILHVAVWYILIDQLSSVENETTCHEQTAGSEEWKVVLRLVIYGQCVLFSLFGLVPVLQEIAFLMGTVPGTEVFLYGSIAYAFLSVLAKVALAATYIAFVHFFPFKTRN